MDFPSEIAILTFVKQCNIKCRFCQQSYDTVPFREMSIDIFKKSIEAIPDKRDCNVGLTPFMEP